MKAIKGIEIKPWYKRFFYAGLHSSEFHSVMSIHFRQHQGKLQSPTATDIIAWSVYLSTFGHPDKNVE